MWSYFFLFALVAIIYFLVYFGQSGATEQNKYKSVIFSMLALAVIVRGSLMFFANEISTPLLRIWELITQHGLENVYGQPQISGMLPGNIFLAALLGHLSNSLPFAFRLPSVLCDIGTMYLICDAAKQSFGSSEIEPILSTKTVKGKKTKEAIAGVALAPLLVYYAINPTLILLGTVIGNSVSIVMLLILFALHFCRKDNYLVALELFGFACLFDVIALPFGVILGCIMLERILDKQDKKILLFQVAGGLVLALVIIVAAFIPFYFENIAGLLSGVADVFWNQLNLTAAGTAGAFNLHAVFYGASASPEAKMFGTTFDVTGYIFLTLSIIYTVYVFFRSKGTARIYYCAAQLMLLMFMTAPRMTPIPLYLTTALLLMSYTFSNNKRDLVSALLVTTFGFFNNLLLFATEMKYLEADILTGQNGVVPISFGLLSLAMVAIVLRNGWRAYVNTQSTPSLTFVQGDQRKMSKNDWIILSITTIVYAAVAFYNLGDNFAAGNYVKLEKYQSYTIELAEIKNISRLQYFKDLGDADFIIDVSQNGTDWENVTQVEFNPCYTWKDVRIDAAAKYIRLTLADLKESGKNCTDVNIVELGIREAVDGVLYPDEPLIMPVNALQLLFDEQDLVPAHNDYHSSMYFDEIYHARTAMEHGRLLLPYENTHPPLGKLLILVGINIFGMNPFGWRCVGVLFGVLMLPVMYLFGKRLTKSTFGGTAACILLAADFMHFAQTRISTIDTYVVFFIMLQYFFMYEYFSIDFAKSSFKKTLPYLLMSGICFGLGIASKWTGIYAGIGLAVLFFTALTRASKEWNKKYSQKYVINSMLWCVAFFIVIPFIIYYVSFIPTVIGTAHLNKGFFGTFMSYQEHMYTYHSKLTDTHGYMSPWYEWPLSIRPIWYYTWEGELVERFAKNASMSSFGNILVWWPGLVAMCYSMYIWVKDKSRIGMFLAIGYWAQYLPWVLVPRATFIYHYFTATPFIILAVAGLMCAIRAKSNKHNIACYAYLAACVLMFVIYYPAISGFPVDLNYLYGLTLFRSWVLGAK